MNTFPTVPHAWAAVHNDVDPKIQGGVEIDLAGRPYTKWFGRLSSLNGAMLKLTKGYKPESYVVTAKPLEDPVGRYSLGVGLAAGTVVTVTAATKKRTVTDGTESFDTEGATGGVTITGTAIQIKGAEEAAVSDDDESSSSSSTPVAPAGPTYGVVVAADLGAPTLVADNEEYVFFTATQTSGALNRASNDAVVEFRLWLKQIDPAPEFNH